MERDISKIPAFASLAMFALILALLATACSSPQSDDSAMGDTAAADASTGVRQAGQVADTDTTPVTQAPAPAIGQPGLHADASCRTDADCTVKNVGNCCGQHLACVNVDSTPDPAAVRAQCEKEGLMSTCGITPVTDCSCVQGTCTTLYAQDATY
jgi:hypothetical protein